MNTSYVELETTINGYPTCLRLYINHKNLFVYVTQKGPDTQLFNKDLEDRLAKFYLFKNKSKFVLCRLANTDSIKSVVFILQEMAEGKDVKEIIKDLASTVIA